MKLNPIPGGGPKRPTQVFFCHCQTPQDIPLTLGTFSKYSFHTFHLHKSKIMSGQVSSGHQSQSQLTQSPVASQLTEVTRVNGVNWDLREMPMEKPLFVYAKERNIQHIFSGKKSRQPVHNFCSDGDFQFVTILYVRSKAFSSACLYWTRLDPGLLPTATSPLSPTRARARAGARPAGGGQGRTQHGAAPTYIPP